MALTSEEKRTLLVIARQMIERCVHGTTTVSPDCYEEAFRFPALDEPRGAFVTIHARGDLRGCIGYIEGIAPLARAVAENAVSAATRDYRFPRLRVDELPDVTIEISALTPPAPIESVDQIEIGKHGLIVSRGEQRGLLLPQVATEHHMSPEVFLQETCRKAGLPRNAWREGAHVFAFSAEVFSEEGEGLVPRRR